MSDAEGMVPESVVPPPTHSLRLVEKWAAHRGDGTSRGGGIFESGRIEPIVRIHHGAAPIYVRDRGKCLMVLGVIEIPEEARHGLARAPPDDRMVFLHGLREILMACPRVGFGFGPSGAENPEQIERIVLDSTIQIAENDPGSFNRFCDAIQEIETILLRAMTFLFEAAPSRKGGAVYSSSTPPPASLYL